MNILWFSLSPCGSMRRNNNTKFTQTWMTTLEDEIKRYLNNMYSIQKHKIVKNFNKFIIIFYLN